jgi:hypothetical protein
MTDATRNELLQRLARLSELAPDMRFGQLIANLATTADAPWDESLWDLEDEKLLAAAAELTADLERRSSSAV